MTRVWERSYLGTFKEAERLMEANPFRITAVISLCQEQVRQAPNISYMHLPIADSRPISWQKFAEIMTALAKSIEKNTVLVHCLGGMNRSPIMLAAWMHRCGYANIDQGLREIAQIREIEPSPTLLVSVRTHLAASLSR